MTITTRSVEQLKKDAKKLKRERAISHGEALDTVARDQGYVSWIALLHERAGRDSQSQLSPS